MLDGLDEVPWQSLAHAYGPASDVPGILRALAAGDRDVIGELYGNIWHQGTVYEATAHAVPFLIELLDVEAVDTAQVLGLLRAIAHGSSYMEVHRDLVRPRSERDSEETRRTVERELGWVRAAHDAVVRGVKTYLRHLTEGEADEVRAAAAYTLGACAAARGEILPALHQRITTDESPLARASAIFAASALGGASAEDVMRWIDDPESLPRLAAALAATRAERELPERMVEVLAADAPRCLVELAHLDWSAGGDPLSFVIERAGARRDVEITLLSRWMRHADAEVRKGAVFAAERTMEVWRSAPSRLVPELARCLSDPDRDVRYWAASHLAGSGRASSAAADSLWDLLEREPLSARSPSRFALQALCKLRDARAARYLATRLVAAERSPAERDAVLNALTPALRLAGEWAEPCFDALVRLIAVAPAGNLRNTVITAVGAFGERARIAVPAIRAELGSHPYVASGVLGDLGPLAAEAMSDLRPMVRHEDPFVRANAARAVWRIAGQAMVALPVLREVIESGARGRAHALTVVSEMGPVAAELAPLLPPLFDADDEWSSVRAAIAYWHLTGEAAPVVPALIEHIVGVPRGHAAVRCLAEIGPPAFAAVPRLRAQVSSEQRRVSSGGIDSSLVEQDELWMELCERALDRIAAV